MEHRIRNRDNLLWRSLENKAKDSDGEIKERTVKLSVIFDDPDAEQSYKRHVQSNRVIRDRISSAVGLVGGWRIFQQAKFDTPPAKILRIIGSIILLCCAFMAGANYTSHPTILKWKLVALPPLGMAGTILVKVLVPLVYNSPWVNVSGSFLRAAVIITNTSRFNLSLYGLGAVSVTGGIFLRDLAFHAALSLLGTLWNEDECRLLCEAQPDLSGVYKALDGRMSSWLGWTSFRSDPVRTCVVIRIFLQTTLGGLLPIALAYSREVKERAAFLDGAKIRFPKRKVGDFFWDGLFCFGAIVVGVGITAALVIAFPELHRLPLILVKGWGAENFI